MGSQSIGSGANLIKILLFVFNVIFFLAGAALLGVAAWIKLDPKAAEFARILSPASGIGDPVIQVAIYVMIGVGGFILLMGFLGCCGACCESTCMLTTYTTCVIILTIAQMAAGTLAAVFSRKIQNELGSAMNFGMDKYHQDDVLAKAWDSMQVWLACCGKNGFRDWHLKGRSDKHRKWWIGHDIWRQHYPASCCKMKVKDATKIRDGNMQDIDACYDGQERGINTEGCEKSLIDWYRRHAYIIMGIAFGVMAIEFIVAAMACCLLSAIKGNKKG